MNAIIRRLFLLLSILSMLAPRAFAQDRQGTYSLPANQVIPGRPWTQIIPDPDKFNWTTTRDGGRPGYRYRGMLPMQQRFYDYIQQKRRDNVPLSAAEQATIRWLVTSRRWPEAPRPNPFWASFMRYLRNQTTTDLNIAQSIMFDQLVSRGLVPVDTPPNANLERIRQYLNSGPFQTRNWFERTFGRVEPWMDNLYSGFGFDLRPAGTASGNSFPAGDPFNGLKATYNISGATLSEPVDRGGFTIARSYQGVLGKGTLTISGTVRVGGYGADVSLAVWAGDQKQEKTFYIENKGNAGNPQNFTLSVPIPASARTGGFAIRLDGRYSMGGGHRGCYITGEFGPSAEQVAADKAAADAKWRQEVEDTLKRLGYENTREGKEIDEMRKALAGGDAAWKAFVNRRLEQLGYDTSPQAAEYRELETAMSAGGPEWDRYVASHNTVDLATAASLVTEGQSLADAGKYNDAVATFTKALAANPSSAAAYIGRGLAKRSLKDNAGALADVEQALQLDPANAEAHRSRSMIRRSANDYAGALADANRAVELAPEQFRSYLTRGLAKEGLKDLNGALADYDRAIQLNPAYAMAYFYRGTTRVNLKDNRGALTDLDRFIALNSTNSSAYNNRGLAKERLGDLAGAVADYEKSISLNPNSETAKRNLANLRSKTSSQNPPAQTPSAGSEIVLFESGNIYGVVNQPTADARFKIAQPHVITYIMTYHWNNGRGTRTGTVALREAGGRLYGPWRVAGSPGQGGVPNANWIATPNMKLPAGEYTIIDSEPSTWSQNSQSGGRGMAVVKGYPSQERDPTITTTPAPTTRAVNAIVEDRSNHNVLIWVEGHEPRGMQDVLNYHLEPGWKGSLKVTIPSDGRINFVAGDGSAGKNGPYDKVLATCLWTLNPQDTSRIPHVIFDASGRLVCGSQ